MASPPILTVATANPHKLRELAELLPRVDLKPVPEGFEMPAETGDTFTANALIKARAVRAAEPGPVLADDSGIEAEALGGRPGVRSARYAGEHATDEENLAKLLEEVAAAGSNRRVVYVCVLAHISAGGEEGLFEGRCNGWLSQNPRGSGGFGYDPAFLPDDIRDGRTMAELLPVEKNAISHRGRAAAMLGAHLTVASSATVPRPQTPG
jgi:XTP/dITP diphosphohydrolase